MRRRSPGSATRTPSASWPDSFNPPQVYPILSPAPTVDGRHSTCPYWRARGLAGTRPASTIWPVGQSPNATGAGPGWLSSFGAPPRVLRRRGLPALHRASWKTTRNPTLLLKLSGWLSFRYAQRAFLLLLFQEPPRVRPGPTIGGAAAAVWPMRMPPPSFANRPSAARSRSPNAGRARTG
jgi:hypothetical protein